MSHSEPLAPSPRKAGALPALGLALALPIAGILCALWLLSAKNVELSAAPGVTRLILASLALIGLSAPLALPGAFILKARLGWFSSALLIWLLGMIALTVLLVLNAAPTPL